jgi:hypothetical protein
VAVNAELFKDPAQQGERAVVDHAAIPALVDAAGRVAIFAIMFAQGEG